MRSAPAPFALGFSNAIRYREASPSEEGDRGCPEACGETGLQRVVPARPLGHCGLPWTARPSVPLLGCRDTEKSLDACSPNTAADRPMPAQGMNRKNETHIFSIWFQIPGASEDGDHSVRAYDDPGLQDMGLHLPDGDDGWFRCEFERSAPTYDAAVLSALGDLQRVFPEADLASVEPDDLATISAVAERMGRSHESIRLLVQGKRGPGGFPRAASAPETRPQVWRWHEVVDWFEQKMAIPVPDSENAAFLAMVNDLLRLRLAAPRVIDNRETASAMAALLPEELAPAS